MDLLNATINFKEGLLLQFRAYRNKALRAAFKLYVGSIAWRTMCLCEKLVQNYDEQTIQDLMKLYGASVAGVIMAEDKKETVTELLSKLSGMKKEEVSYIINRLEKGLDRKALDEFKNGSSRDLAKLANVAVEQYK